MGSTIYHADTCPVCLYRVRVKEDGTMVSHYYKGQKANGRCNGSGRVPIHKRTRRNNVHPAAYEELSKATSIAEITPEENIDLLARIKRLWKK